MSGSAVGGWQSSRALAAASARAAATAAAHAAHVASVTSPSADSAASLELARAADQRIAAHASWTALVAPPHVRRRLELAHDPTADPSEAEEAARTTKAVRSLLPPHAILAAARGIYPEEDSTLSGKPGRRRRPAAPRTAHLGIADRVDLSLSLAQNAREAACIRKEQLMQQQQTNPPGAAAASVTNSTRVSPTRAPLSLSSTLPAALPLSTDPSPSSPLIDSLLSSSFFRTSYTHRFEDEDLGLAFSDKQALQKCRNMESYKRDCQRKIQEARAMAAATAESKDAASESASRRSKSRSHARRKSSASHSPAPLLAAGATNAATAAVASVMSAYAFNDESSDESGTEGETGRGFLDRIRAETARQQRQGPRAATSGGEGAAPQQIVPQFGTEEDHRAVTPSTFSLPSRPATSPVISATAQQLSSPRSGSRAKHEFSASAALPPTTSTAPHPEVLAELARLRSEVHARDRAQAKHVGVLHELAGSTTAAGGMLEAPLESEETEEEEKSVTPALAVAPSAAAPSRSRFGTRHDPFYTALACWMSQHGKLAKSAVVDPAQVERCAAMFDLLDENGDGVVQLTEMSRALSALGGGGVKIDLSALKSSLSGFDPDADGCLSFEEFLHGFSSISTWESHLSQLFAARAEAQAKAGTLRREARLWKEVEARVERARKARVAREKAEAAAKEQAAAEEAKKEQERRTKERLRAERIARQNQERAPPQLLAASALASHSSAALLYGVVPEEPEQQPPQRATEEPEQKQSVSPAISHTAPPQPSPRSPVVSSRRITVASSPTSMPLSGGSGSTRPPVLVLAAPSASIRPPVLALTPSSLASPRKLKVKAPAAPTAPVVHSFVDIQSQLLGGKPVAPLPAVGVAVHLDLEERQAIAELRARTASRNAAAESKFLSLTQPRVAATASATLKDSRAYDRALKRKKARRPNRALPPEVAAALGLPATQDRGKLAPASARGNRSPIRLLAQSAPVASAAAASSTAVTPANAAAALASDPSVSPASTAPAPRPTTSHADLPFFLWTSAFQRHSRLDSLIKDHSSEQATDEIAQAQSIEEARRDIESSFQAAQVREQQQLREQMEAMNAAGHSAAAMALGRTLIGPPTTAAAKPPRSRRASLLPAVAVGRDLAEAPRSATPTKAAPAAVSKSPLLSMSLLDTSAAAGASSHHSSLVLAQMIAEEEKQTEASELAAAAAVGSVTSRSKGHRRNPSSGDDSVSSSSALHTSRSRFGQHQSRRSIESLAAMAAAARGPTPPLSFAPTAQTHAPQPRPPSQSGSKKSNAKPTTALALLSQVAASIAAAGAEARRIAAEASPNVHAHVLARVPLSATASEDEIAQHAAAMAAAGDDAEQLSGSKSRNSGSFKSAAASPVRASSASGSRPSSRQRVRRGDQLSYVTITDLTHVSAFPHQLQTHHGIGLKPANPAATEAILSPRSSGRMFARGNGMVEEASTDEQHQQRGHLRQASRSSGFTAASTAALVSAATPLGRSLSPSSPSASPSKRDTIRLRRGESLSPAGVVPEQSPSDTPTIEEDGYTFPAAGSADSSIGPAATVLPVKSSVRLPVDRAHHLRTLSSLWHSVREEGAQTVLDAIALATRDGTLAPTSPANFRPACRNGSTATAGAVGTGGRQAGVLKPCAPLTPRSAGATPSSTTAATGMPAAAPAPAPHPSPPAPVLLQLKQTSLAKRALSIAAPTPAPAAPVLPSTLSARASMVLSYPRPLPDGPSDDDEDLCSDDDGIVSPGVGSGGRSVVGSAQNTPHLRREPLQAHTLDDLDD